MLQFMCKDGKHGSTCSVSKTLDSHKTFPSSIFDLLLSHSLHPLSILLRIPFPSLNLSLSPISASWSSILPLFGKYIVNILTHIHVIRVDLDHIREGEVVIGWLTFQSWKWIDETKSRRGKVNNKVQVSTRKYSTRFDPATKFWTRTETTLFGSVLFTRDIYSESSVLKIISFLRYIVCFMVQNLYRTNNISLDLIQTRGSE